MRRRIGDRIVIQLTTRAKVLAAAVILSGSYLASMAFNAPGSGAADDSFRANFDPGVVIVMPTDPNAAPVPDRPAMEPEPPAQGLDDDGVRAL